MAVYSTNQNRQLYVAAGVENSLASIQGAANLGKVFVGTDKDGCKFITQNGYGGIVRSDLINPKSIMWATATGPKDTEIKLKAYALELKSTVNSGNPIVGQDYIVRINFRQMYGMSDEDIYQKYGAVHAKSAVKGDFLKEMAYSLFKNFNRLYAPLLYVGLADGSNFTLIKSASKNASGTITFTYVPTAEVPASYNSGSGKYQASAISSPTKLIIAEMSQVGEWSLGTKQYTPVYFEVIPTTVTDSTLGEVEWGTVSEYTDYNEVVGNGYNYADLEYFCMGERGDQYRNVGWPKSIPTKYFVNPANTYYSLDIHYAYQGTCEDIQKSEKTITILATAKATIDSVITALGIGDKVHATDLYDGTANNTAAYPTASIEERVEDLEDYNQTNP